MAGNCNSDLDKFDPWEGAQSPREWVMGPWQWGKPRASGLMPRCQTVGWRWPRKGQAGPWQHRKLQSGGVHPRVAAVLESHQPRAGLPRGSPAWEGLTPLSGSHPPCPVRGPSLGLSGFSLRLGATLPTSPSSGG